MLASVYLQVDTSVYIYIPFSVPYTNICKYWMMHVCTLQLPGGTQDVLAVVTSTQRSNAQQCGAWQESCDIDLERVKCSCVTAVWEASLGQIMQGTMHVRCIYIHKLCTYACMSHTGQLHKLYSTPLNRPIVHWPPPVFQQSSHPMTLRWRLP